MAQGKTETGVDRQRPSAEIPGVPEEPAAAGNRASHALRNGAGGGRIDSVNGDSAIHHSAQVSLGLILFSLDALDREALAEINLFVDGIDSQASHGRSHASEDCPSSIDDLRKCLAVRIKALPPEPLIAVGARVEAIDKSFR